MFCSKCGYELKDGTNFCRKCGSKSIFNNLIPNEEKSTFDLDDSLKENNTRQINTNEINNKDINNKQTNSKSSTINNLNLKVLLSLVF